MGPEHHFGSFGFYVLDLHHPLTIWSYLPAGVGPAAKGDPGEGIPALHPEAGVREGVQAGPQAR